jgi:hypothetical protein
VSSSPRRWWIGSAALTVLTLIFVLVWPGQQEPGYQGKKLSEWLEIARNPEFDHSRQQADAEAAVRSIGTNALPLLLKWVNYAPARSQVMSQLQEWKLLRHLRYLQLPLRPTKRDEKQFTVAIKGFEILGPLAGPAAPRLRKIAADGNLRGRDIMRVAVSIEVWAHEDQALRKGMPELLARLDGQDLWGLLQSIGPESAVFLAILTDYLHHTNERVRVAAATLLAMDTNLDIPTTVRSDAERVLAQADPALVQWLRPKK